MVSFLFVRNALLISAFVTTVVADARNWNPTGEGCVDTQGFLSCYEAQTNNAVGCIKVCNSTTKAATQINQDCILGCNGAWLAGNIGCWIQSCWNQVCPPSTRRFWIYLTKLGLLMRVSTCSHQLFRRSRPCPERQCAILPTTRQCLHWCML